MADITMDVRPFDPESDLEQVLRLFELVFGWTPARAIWQWKYLPPWSNRPNAWVSLVAGQIVGHAGVIPLRGLVNGQEVPYAQFADIMLHPEFHGRINYLSGPNSALAAIRRDSPHTVVYGFAGKRAALWYQRLLGKSALVAECQELVVSQPNPAMDRSTESELRVQKWDWEALEIDPVWENLKGVVKTGLIRDRSYLRWRYANHPTHRYHLFGVHLGGKAIGWLVTARIKKDEAELPEVRVVDLLLPKEILIQALEEAALTIPARALVAWLPANFRPASVQTRATETLAIHHLGTPLLGAENAQNQPYFTLGEADEWWW